MGIALLSFVPALAGLLLPRKLPRTPQTWLLAALAAALFVVLLTYLPVVSEVGHLEFDFPWVPELGLSLTLYLDGLALLFALIVTGIGAVILLYAGYYFEDSAERGRFYALLLGFMSAMLALVLAGNVLTLFIAWELTSLLSFLLISFKNEKEEARAGALQALIITGGGGLALFVGLLLLGTAAGSMRISDILANETLTQHPWYTPFTLLLFAGCFSKSAQFPLHFWLPGAMSAPTPASAYLHSATMVKAGIYLLARLYPPLHETLLWQNTLLLVGMSTLAVGALFALRQRDLKAALAYSTISQLGALTALCALPDYLGTKALLVGVLAHSLYKATLFLMVGAVDHQTGTRNLDELGGLRKTMPQWALVTVVAALSMAGFPPLLGFVAKETLLEAMLRQPLALFVVVFSAVLTVAMAVIMVWEVFFGESRSAAHHDEHHAQHPVPWQMLLGPLLLAAASILAGLNLEGFVTPLIDPTLEKEFELVLFPGFNLPFFISVIAFPSGLTLFSTRAIWRRARVPQPPDAAAIYRALVGSVERAADLVLRSQGGKIRYYLIVILVAMSLLMATGGLLRVFEQPWPFEFSGSTDVLKTALLLFTLGATLASVVFKNHLTATLCLGVAGYSIGGVFLLEPAPDVALVQFLVETLATVLLIIMLVKISPQARERAIANIWSNTRRGLARDIILSSIIGGGVALFALAAVLHRPIPQTIALWHLDNALPLVGIPDVVGAIITDFRAMDTVIEITVFGIVGLGVLTLLTVTKPVGDWPLRPLQALRSIDLRTLRIKRPTPEAPDAPPSAIFDTQTPGMRFATPLTRTIAKIVLPVALLLALAQLLYAGEGPGDGFTAGVTSGLGVALWYIVFGYGETRRRLRWLRPRRLIGGGIALVVLNAVVPMFFGYPFLAHLSFDLPLPANLHLSSTLVFEIGIFLTVFGSSSLVMQAIAQPRDVEEA